MIERGLRADKERVLKSLAAVVAEFGSNDDHHYNRLLQRMPASCTAGANHDLLVGAGVIIVSPFLKAGHIGQSSSESIFSFSSSI